MKSLVRPGPQWLPVAGFVFAFWVLDAACFRFALWRLPDETAWDTAHLYHYERTARRLARGKAPDEWRVIVTGSSLAPYGVLPASMERRLRAAGVEGARVELLSFQGMHPGHMLAAAGRLRAARPDFVVVPLGFVDFRLERPLVLGLLDDLERGEDRPEALRRLREDLLGDARLRVIAPLGRLRVFRDDLNAKAFASGIVAAGIAAYRYKGVLGDPLKRLLDNRFSRGRSYRRYAGVPVGGGNVHHRGWTGVQFSLRLSPALLRNGLWIEAPPELMRAAAERGVAARLLVTHQKGEPARRVPLKPGWQNVRLDAGVVGGIVRFSVEPGWDSSLLADRLGVRLAARAGRSDFVRPPREIRREDILYSVYTDAEYRASYATRIRGFDRVGMEYLQSLEQARAAWARRPFDAELPAFQALSDFLGELERAGIPVLIVLAPENPLVLAGHAPGTWSTDYREFMAGFGRGAGANAWFLDARRDFAMQEFYDHHHLTYFGAERFTDRLASEIVRRRPQIRAARGDSGP